MKKIMSLGVMALFGASITLSWADKLDYGSNLNGIAAGQPARAADVKGAFNAIKTAIDGCTADMVKVGAVCVDKYEASVWNAAGNTQYGTSLGMDDYPCVDNANDCSATDNTGAANAAAIYAKSMTGVEPSRYITWFQAAQACANSGKRLITNAEWQMAAAGTPDDGTCNAVANVNAVTTTGGTAGCVSNFGAVDMVGNANEFVADWIQGNGTVAANVKANNGAYGNDNIVAGNAANKGAGSDGMPAAIVRGGSAGTVAADAGVFFFLSNGAPSISDLVTGFRCAR